MGTPSPSLLSPTNADECRLIFEMFLAKAGVALEPASYEVPYPSPSPSSSDTHPSREASDVTLELSLVELFLGGDAVEPPQPPVPRKRRSKKKSEAAAPAAPAPVEELPAEPRKYTAVATLEAPVATPRAYTPTEVRS